MAESKTKAPSVEYRHNVAIGRHEIGVRVEGLFVPFATLDDARYAQLVENAENVLASEGEPEEVPE